MWAAAADHIKTIGVAATIAAAGTGAWTTLGLPVPASVQMVDLRIDKVNGSIKGLTQLVLEGQLEEHELARSAMRAERVALEQTLKVSPSEAQFTIQARIGSLDDKLKAMDERDTVLRAKIQVLRDGRV